LTISLSSIKGTAGLGDGDGVTVIIVDEDRLDISFDLLLASFLLHPDVKKTDTKKHINVNIITGRLKRENTMILCSADFFVSHFLTREFLILFIFL
jgi:hypothetical protein